MKKILLFLLMISTQAFSHPVIYEGGTVISSQSMASFSDNQVTYSFHPQWAVGPNLWRFNQEEDKTEFGLMRLNHLLKRWNGPDSQANIYLASGLGAALTSIEDRPTKVGYLLGAEADWETRTLFTSLKYYQFSSPRLTDISMTQARIGYSPLEADFDKLQVWAMLQGMYMPDVDRTVMVTPMLRFFYHNVLWEVGSSFRSEWFLNLMIHI